MAEAAALPETAVDENPRVRPQDPLHVREAPRHRCAETLLQRLEARVRCQLFLDGGEHRVRRRRDDMVDRHRRRAPGEHLQETCQKIAARFVTDAVDQIEVDLVETQIVRPLDRAADFIQARLGAIDRFQRRAAPRLDAAAQAVEAERAHQRQRLGAQTARQELEGPTTPGREREVSVERAEQPLELRLGEEVRRPAADVLILHHPGARRLGQEIDLAFQPLQIVLDLPVRLLERRAALTEGADLRTERDVGVEPEGMAGPFVLEAFGPDGADLLAGQ